MYAMYTIRRRLGCKGNPSSVIYSQEVDTGNRRHERRPAFVAAAPPLHSASQPYNIKYGVPGRSTGSSYLIGIESRTMTRMIKGRADNDIKRRTNVRIDIIGTRNREVWGAMDSAPARHVALPWQSTCTHAHYPPRRPRALEGAPTPSSMSIRFICIQFGDRNANTASSYTYWSFGIPPMTLLLLCFLECEPPAQRRAGLVAPLISRSSTGRMRARSSVDGGRRIIGLWDEPKTGKWISSGSLSSSSSASSTEFDIVLCRTVKFTLNIASATPPGDDTTNENVRWTRSCIRTYVRRASLQNGVGRSCELS